MFYIVLLKDYLVYHYKDLYFLYLWLFEIFLNRSTQHNNFYNYFVHLCYLNYYKDLHLLLQQQEQNIFLLYIFQRMIFLKVVYYNFAQFQSFFYLFIDYLILYSVLVFVHLELNFFL